ncbi:hypothetical protein ACOMHN_030168 [Nucella lapillus]
MSHVIVRLQFIILVGFLIAACNVLPAQAAVKLKLEGTPKSKIVQKEGLYAASDNVIILNKDNMNYHVHGQSKVWLIQFYNSWCGHCIHFAPTWKSFASDVKGWRQVVSVGAVDCSTGENLKVCRRFNIVSYPAILMVAPYFDGDPSKDGMVMLMRTREKSTMKDAVLQNVTKPAFPVPLAWPLFRSVRNVTEAWQDAKQTPKLVVIVFEEQRSTVGAEVILDLVGYPDILVRRMLKSDVKNMGDIMYPSVYKVQKNATIQHLISGTGDAGSDRRRFVDHLLSVTGHLDSQGHRLRGEGHLADDGGSLVNSMDQSERETSGRQQQGQAVRVYMQDLESTLTYSLRHEVALHNFIQGERLDALRRFVSVLAKYFPGRPPVTRLLHKLDDYLKKTEVLTGETWLAAINSSQDKEAFLPDKVRWVGCRGSLPRYRGYPCGLWMLFHVLTVAVYERTQGASGQETPLAIRDYMEHFFGCEECAQNFLKAAGAHLEHKTHTPSDSALWLWMAHNRANKRLHGEISEDPQHPKIQFPSSRACPKCRPEQDSESDKVPWWNSSAVLAFLVKVYGKKNLILNSSQEETWVDDDDGEQEMDWWHIQRKKAKHTKHMYRQSYQNEASFSAGKTRKKLVPAVQYLPMKGGLGYGLWGLNGVDGGVYMVFYVLCVLIVVGLYYHFIVQRRSKLPCFGCRTV